MDSVCFFGRRRRSVSNVTAVKASIFSPSRVELCNTELFSSLFFFFFLETSQTGAFVVFTCLKQCQFPVFFFPSSLSKCLHGSSQLGSRWRRQRQMCPLFVFQVSQLGPASACVCLSVCACVFVCVAPPMRCHPCLGVFHFPPNVLSLFVVHRSSAALFIRLLLPR